MIRKVTLLFLACLGMFASARAQHCGFDVRHQQMMTANPMYAQRVQQMNTQIASILQAQQNSNALIVNTPNGPVYQIPVVIHVIHTGGAVGSVYNPSASQLQGMITYLNQSYAATYPGYPNTSNGGTYIPLQFVLAQRDPNCNATTGIVRVNGSSVPNYTADGMSMDFPNTPGADEAVVKALSVWPNTQYYNIWVVNKIEGNDGISGGGPYTAGFAYFPGAPASVDGTVMLASKAISGEITLPHEIGHAFSLYHTFQGDAGGSVCPTNNNCATDGDQVCDTDPHKRSPFNCPNGTNPCTNQPYGTVVHNFMDYSNCQDRFTAGQKTRLLGALVTTGRASLISSLGGVALPATPMPTVCVPTGVLNPSNVGVRGVNISDATLTYMDVNSQGYTGDGNLVYIDNTCKHQVELTAGNIYNFTIATGSNNAKGKVFVDYNNDGNFQATEEVYSFTSSPGSQTTFQYTVPTTTTIPSLISCVPLRMRVITDVGSGPAVVACPTTLGGGQVEDYAVVIRGGGATTGSVTVSLTSGSNPSCFNSPLTFTAVPGTGLTATGFKWFVNGSYTGISTNTYSSSTLNNGDLVSVRMYFAGTCGNDSSNSINYLVQRAATVPAAVSIAVTTGTNPGCPGQTLTFTATPVNGGTAPTYQWKVNGNPVGTNSPTYTAVFNNNDVVTVDMVSNSACASPTNATSAAVTIQHMFDVQNITIAADNNPVCAGKPVTFTATVTNGGTGQQYLWLVNGAVVAGANSATYTTSSLANNSVVNAVSTAGGPCLLNPVDTSDPVVMSILPSDTPHISIAITKGSNPGCLDSLIEFTATVTKHGATPDLVWYVNGIAVDTGYIYSTSTLMNGDIVTLRSAATDTACYTADTLLSTPIVMVRSSTPAAPTISFIGNMLVSNVGGTLQWFGPTGKITGATNQSYHPTQAGAYYAVVYNNGCNSAPSNILTVSLLDIATYDMSQVKIYPNPTSGTLTLDWGTKTADVRIDIYSATGQGLLHEELQNGTRKLINLSHFANGNYFVVIRDHEGNIGSVRITVSK
jgi:hypothetical protein